MPRFGRNGKKPQAQKAAIRNGYGLGYRRQTEKVRACKNGIWADPQFSAPTKIELGINLKTGILYALVEVRGARTPTAAAIDFYLFDLDDHLHLHGAV